MDDDFDQRMELRRQRREQMRLEAEKGFSTTEDDEEAARERRRKAREERIKRAEMEENSSSSADTTQVNNIHSVTETDPSSTTAEVDSTGGVEDDAVLLDRLAKREERRQRRLKEALERQKEFDPTVTDGNVPDINNHSPEVEEQNRTTLEQDVEGKTTKEVVTTNSWSRKEDDDKEEIKEEEVPIKEEEVEESDQVEKQKNEEDVEEMQIIPEKEIIELTTPLEECMFEVSITPNTKDEKTKKREVEKVELEKPKLRSVKKDEKEPTRAKQQDGGAAHSMGAEDQKRLEAERKLEELKRRRDEADSEEVEKMRQKQQEAEVELEELKKKREGRKKIIEEEEKQKKEQLAEKKAKEQEERKRLREEIEQRRKEAAEKKKQMEESTDGDKKPFTLGVTPKGKIGEKAEFLNQRAQKGVVPRTTHTPIVSKIGNRLEQYTAAVQTNRDVRSPKSPVSDLPETPSIRNIKSMWEKGTETADIKVGVASLTKGWGKSPADSGKTGPVTPTVTAEKAEDQKPVDVGNKRSQWETKGPASAKVTVAGKSKPVTNAGMRR
ncbi:hypothetical protein UPYG_G00271350 [Umbra pygmaea]|uniref:Uncharacterized protein n=1 Tax=Umbra pygmaea TaxID=75934 RepID=A0ABD0WCJ1_UMBPY